MHVKYMRIVFLLRRENKIEAEFKFFEYESPFKTF